jgi:thiamine biosynthesis protein ThiS
VLYNRAVTIRVNGQERDVPAGQTLRALVESHQLKPEKVAIELNRRLARADKYDLPLSPGDEVEIVTFVGGG